MAALGAALATGYGVASADTGADGSAASANHANASSKSPAAGKAKKTATDRAKTTSTGAEKSPTSGTDSLPASGTAITVGSHEESSSPLDDPPNTTPPVSSSNTNVDPTPLTRKNTPQPAWATRTRAVVTAKPAQSPLPANSPRPALPVSDPFASLWVGVREAEHRFTNRTPTANPTSSASDPQTGVITGNVNANDLDGDPLAYAVTAAPTHGTVTVGSDGSYTYAPDAGFALTGGTDTARIQISETNAATHVHGIKGLFAKLVKALSGGRVNLPDGSTTTAVLQLSVMPTGTAVNHAPVAPASQGTVTYDPATGIATGNLGFTDPDSDPLTYTVTTTPTHGSVTVATNGTYTYTPTPAGRAQAATTPGLTDTFTVTASDGQLSTPTSLQVTVTPMPVVSGPVSIQVGINPDQVAVTPDGLTAYVANNGRYVSSGQPHVGDSVSVINTTTNTVIKTIQVGNHPSGVAITPDGSTVYVTNFDDDTVSVISTITDTVITTIAVGGNPSRVVVTADGSRALVANTNTDAQANGSLSVINTATKTVVSTIGLVDNVTRFQPSAVVPNADGSVIYVTNRLGSYTDVVNGGMVTRLVYTGGPYPNETAPVSAVLVDDTLYVADDYYGQVTVVDLAGNEGNGAITQRINLPVTPAQIVRSLDGKSLYVGGGNEIVKVDVATGNVTTVATITDAIIQGLALSPDGTVLYATNPGTANESDDSVVVIPLT